MLFSHPGTGTQHESCSCDSSEPYHLNGDIMSSTLYILAATQNSDHPQGIWTHDPSFYNIIIDTESGVDRQEALASAANQLREKINGATAFDHN